MNWNGKNLKGFQNFGRKKWLFWKFYWKSFQTSSKNKKADKFTRANASANSDLTVKIIQNICIYWYIVSQSICNCSKKWAWLEKKKIYFQIDRYIINIFKVLVTQSCPTFSTPWTVTHQALLSMEFFRQEHWSG